MKKGVVKKGILAVIVACGLTAFSSPTHAVPSLQLDITGGVYNTATETTVSTSTAFELNAYLQPSSSTPTTGTYYLSIAVVPQYGPVPGDLGSFVFNGVTYDATSGMEYGVPPSEQNLAHDGGDLGQHGIYETFFVEVPFQFDGTAVNGLYEESFLLDISGLDDGYGLHFDLYNEKYRNGDTDIKNFAPFSHDAESCLVDNGGCKQVPEPSILLYLGSGFLGMLALRRRRK